MLDYDFMRTAFAASGVVALLAGAVGYFLVMRGQTFAGHALSHVGFTGATGAVLLGLSPIWGLVGFTVLAALAMGMLGEKLSGRDVAIGMTLSLALGLGLLFLHFYTAYASQATALLFGNVLGVSQGALWTLAILGFISLLALGVLARPLFFISLQPEVAEAKGVPVRFVATVFLVIVAIAVAECTQIVGVLLVFTLMVGPGQRRSARCPARLDGSLGRAVARIPDGLADQLLDHGSLGGVLFPQSAPSAAGFDETGQAPALSSARRWWPNARNPPSWRSEVRR